MSAAPLPPLNPPPVIEGTWEEILQHAPQLAGHRLRITLLNSNSESAGSSLPAPGSPEAVLQWIAELKTTLAQRPALGPWDDSRDAAYEHLLK